MKALVIENQYEVDLEIETFIDDSDLFESVKYAIGSSHRNPKELVEYLEERDALVAASTFMDKDQLEEIAELIAKLEGKKIFLHRFEDKLSEWLKEERTYRFYDWARFKINLKHIFERNEVYSFEEDWEDQTIQDKYWERMDFASKEGRGKFKHKKLEL